MKGIIHIKYVCIAFSTPHQGGVYGPPPPWARRGVGDMDSLVGEDVGCPSRRELRLPEPPSRVCVRPATLWACSACPYPVRACAVGAVSGDKIPIVAKKK